MAKIRAALDQASQSEPTVPSLRSAPSEHPSRQQSSQDKTDAGTVSTEVGSDDEKFYEQLEKDFVSDITGWYLQWCMNLAIDLVVPLKSIWLVIREETAGKAKIQVLQLQTPTRSRELLWVAGLAVFDRVYRCCIPRDGMSVAELVNLGASVVCKLIMQLYGDLDVE
jgi:hypothetical protein